MSYRVVRYRKKGDDDVTCWGVVVDESVRPLAGNYATTGALLERGRDEIAALARAGSLAGIVPLAGLDLLSPVTHPCRIVAQAINFRSHLEENGFDPDRRSFDMLFRKSSASITGPVSPIVRPAHVRLLDYEIEVGVVVGKAMRGPLHIEEADLEHWVGGLVVANDVSARDVQILETQFYKGKSYRTFCPLGPHLWIPEPGDLATFLDLELVLEVNGEVRQRGTCREMIYRPAEALSEISTLEDLDPGDLVLTGTPGGVALRTPTPWLQKLSALLPDELRWKLFVRSQEGRSEYLKAGDIVRATIRTPDGRIDLGMQETPVVDAT
jgi:2-keto-4-pentenoate hydratase/2-oxohepta-3-ene-1,7-dioic acid hydratase in catechol pathway